MENSAVFVIRQIVVRRVLSNLRIILYLILSINKSKDVGTCETRFTIVVSNTVNNRLLWQGSRRTVYLPQKPLRVHGEKHIVETAVKPLTQ